MAQWIIPLQFFFISHLNVSNVVSSHYLIFILANGWGVVLDIDVSLACCCWLQMETDANSSLDCGDVIMSAIASQITSLTIVYSTVYSDADQRKHQSSVSLAFMRGIHLGPVNSPHKWPVTRRMFPFDDVIMLIAGLWGDYAKLPILSSIFLHCSLHLWSNHC